MKSSLRSDEIFGAPPQMKLNPPLTPAARQISSRSDFIHRWWISSANGGFSWKKPSRNSTWLFFLAQPFKIDPQSKFFRNRSVVQSQRIDLSLGDDGSSTWPLSSGVLLHACKRNLCKKQVKTKIYYHPYTWRCSSFHRQRIRMFFLDLLFPQYNRMLNPYRSKWSILQ